MCAMFGRRSCSPAAPNESRFLLASLLGMTIFRGRKNDSSRRVAMTSFWGGMTVLASLSDDNFPGTDNDPRRSHGHLVGRQKEFLPLFRGRRNLRGLRRERLTVPSW